MIDPPSVSLAPASAPPRFVERRANARRRADAPEGTGVLVFDERLRLRLASDTLVSLLDLPAELVSETPSLADLLGGGRLSAGGLRAVLRLCAAAAAGEGGFDGSALIELRVGLTATLRVRSLSPRRWIAAFEPVAEAADGSGGGLRDPLTGLLGSAVLHERLRAALLRPAGPGRQVGLLVLDFDDFAGINERLGRATGDAVLRAAASRLRGSLRADDVLVRLAGDRFAVLQANPPEAEATGVVIGRLMELLRQPYVVKGRLLQVGASIGHALAPGDARDAEGLLRRAELALRDAKEAARRRGRRGAADPDPGALPDGILFDDVAPDEPAPVASNAKPKLQHRLRAHREPAWHCSAQRDVASGVVVGYAAYPSSQAAVHASSGLRAAAERARQVQRFGSWPVLTVRAGDADLADAAAMLATLQSAARLAGVEYAQLQVEVDAENFAAAAALATLHAVHAAGARVCLGGFGRPGAAVDGVARFPFDALMLHPALLPRDPATPCADGLDRPALLRGIAALGRSLGATVGIAGVTTPAQREQARLAGCMLVQDAGEEAGSWRTGSDVTFRGAAPQA